MTRRLSAALLVLFTVVGALLATAGRSSAAGNGQHVRPAQLRRTHQSALIFGPVLDWSSDSAAAYDARLGAVPRLFGQSVNYPVRPNDAHYLRQFVAQVAANKAVALLAVNPTQPLSSLTRSDARRLAHTLRTLHRKYRVAFYVQFAPDMNGNWTSWGQQPKRYKTAFRIVARAVHSALPRSVAGMVWSPTYGAGYPFRHASGRVRGSARRVRPALDTNGDGRVDDRDDPYSPYFPGNAAVDLVGLSIYDYGRHQPYRKNTLPAPGQYAAELTGTFGYAHPRGAGRDFVGIYSLGMHHPMLVNTGALFDTRARRGLRQLAIKRAWWRQVLAPATQRAFPTIKAIAWLEQRRREPESGDAVIDWRATGTPRLARALRTDLRHFGIRLRRLPRSAPPKQPTSEPAKPTSGAARPHVDVVSRSTGAGLGADAIAAAVLVALLAGAGVARKVRPSWRYAEESAGADRRLDLLRGAVLTAVVVSDVSVVCRAPMSAVSGVGAVFGPEAFVMVWGLALGAVIAAGLSDGGVWQPMRTVLASTRRLWLAAVVVVLAVFALTYVPWLDTASVTRGVAAGTGLPSAPPVTANLYPGAAALLGYPPPGTAARALLLLRIGPWPVSIAGLLVVLGVAATLLVPVLRGRWCWAVVGVSCALWALGLGHPVVLLDTQFERAFPLLVWQLPFVAGLVLGVHRRRVVAALKGRRALGWLSVAVAGYAVTLGALAAIGGRAAVFAGHWFAAGSAEPGRLADALLLVIAAYAVLTCCWRPVARLLGWWLEPLGRRSTFVLLVHVFAVIAVASSAGNAGGGGRAVVTELAVIVALWLLSLPLPAVRRTALRLAPVRLPALRRAARRTPVAPVARRRSRPRAAAEEPLEASAPTARAGLARHDAPV